MRCWAEVLLNTPVQSLMQFDKIIETKYPAQAQIESEPCSTLPMQDKEIML